jgi:hypothetical protein
MGAAGAVLVPLEDGKGMHAEAAGNLDFLEPCLVLSNT